MHSVAVLTSLVKSLLNVNFVCMTRCTERTSHPLARFMRKARQIVASTYVQGRQAGSRRKAALKNMFSFEGKHDASEIVHNKTREI